MAHRTDDTSDRDIVLSRAFDAPRALVFNAWTDPKHLARWWGPRGFTHTTKQADIREGGAWVFTMHGPDGKDYPNRISFLEIKAPDLLRYVHGDPTDENFRTTVTFEDKAGKTLVTMRSLFPTASAREHVIRTFKADEGGKTRVTLEWCPYEATAEERAAFDSAHPSMVGGWTGTFENLDAYIAKEAR
jgi:uncharacterized protein YndB with AHSA1/START domain